MNKSKKSIETKLAHAGLLADKYTGAISTPIYQTATFGHPSLGHSTGFDYTRTANPTRTVLERVLADLEGGVAASTFASGMAAITSIQALFKPGDKILVSDDLYGGTFRLFEKCFKPWGLDAEYCDFSDVNNLKKQVNHTVRAFFIETPTNPLMKITDIRKLSKLAQLNDILLIVDNTLMTPYCQRPLELGADIVVHSGTKYLSGHNDTLFGAVVSRTKKVAEKIAYTQNATGGIVSPFDSWLALRGIKTLAIRMDRAQENAARIAKWLKVNRSVSEVYFPGLTTHPGHKTHLGQSSGSGAMISCRFTSKKAAQKVINKVKVITFAESLGGVESLITYPTSQTHADIPESCRKSIGITDDLVRLSVGIENIDELIEDLRQAIG